MKHLFIPYELAVIAKEKGFNEICLAWFPNHNTKEVEYTPGSWWQHEEGASNIPAPLYQQIVDWFDSKRVYITIDCDFDKMGKYNRGYTPVVNGVNYYHENDCFEDKYEALNKAIEEAFKLI